MQLTEACLKTNWHILSSYRVVDEAVMMSLNSRNGVTLTKYRAIDMLRKIDEKKKAKMEAAQENQMVRKQRQLERQGKEKEEEERGIEREEKKKKRGAAKATKVTQAAIVKEHAQRQREQRASEKR